MSSELQDTVDQGECFFYNELLGRLWTCWYDATDAAKETADVESLSSPGLALFDPEKTASESHDPKRSLQNEAPVELGQSHHSVADGAKLGSQPSAESAPLGQPSLQGEEELALGRKHHEIASILTVSTVALSVHFPQYMIRVAADNVQVDTNTDGDTNRDSDIDSAIGHSSI